MRSSLRVLMGSAAAICLWAAAANAEDVITYAGYGGSYQEAVSKGALQPLAKEMGITIKEETISSLADVKVQVEAGDVSIDLAEQNVNDCLVGAAQDLWEPLDYSIIKADALDQTYVKPTWVAGLTYWSTVLAYNTEKYGANPPASWADFWDVEKFPGTRGMWNNPYHNVEIALMADGVPPDQLYPLDLDRAFKKLQEIKPHITVWWTSGAQAAQLMKDGEMEMSPMWNGRVSAIMAEDAPVALTFNQGILALDCAVIPKGAKNKDLAMKVLARLLEPDLQAGIPQYIAYGPVNPKAFEGGLISAELAATLNSAPDNAKSQITVDDFWWGDVANATKVQEMWDALVQE